MSIVFLCGSSAYREEFERVARELALDDRSALVPVWPAAETGPADQLRLRDLRLRQLDLCDEVFVVNPGDDVDPDTYEEVLYAIAKHKPVRFTVPSRHGNTFRTAAHVALADAPRPGSRWRHYAGGEYTVLVCSIAEDTLEPLVTYGGATDGFAVTRKLSVWREEVDVGAVNLVPRFSPLPDDDDTAEA